MKTFALRIYQFLTQSERDAKKRKRVIDTTSHTALSEPDLKKAQPPKAQPPPRSALSTVVRDAAPPKYGQAIADKEATYENHVEAPVAAEQKPLETASLTDPQSNLCASVAALPAPPPSPQQVQDGLDMVSADTGQQAVAKPPVTTLLKSPTSFATASSRRPGYGVS